MKYKESEGLKKVNIANVFVQMFYDLGLELVTFFFTETFS